MAVSSFDATATGNRTDPLTRLWEVLTSGWWAAVVLMCLAGVAVLLTASPALRASPVIPSAARATSGLLPGDWLIRAALALVALTLLVRFADRLLLVVHLRHQLLRARTLFLDQENACVGDLPLESTDGRLAGQVRRWPGGWLYRIWPGEDGDADLWVERLAPAVWSDLVLHAGGLLLVAGLFVSSQWGWVEHDIPLAAGEEANITHTPGASLAVQSVAGEENDPGSRVTLTLPGGGRTEATVSRAGPLLGALSVFHSAVGPALRVTVDDAKGQKVLLQPSGARARPSTSVALKFASGQDEGYVTVPSLGLSVRVVRYQSLPEEGYHVPVYLVRAYQGNQATPLFTRHVWQETSYAWQSHTFYLQPEAFGQFTVGTDPGWWVMLAGVLLLVLGALARQVAAPVLVRVSRPDLERPEQVEIQVWRRRSRSGGQPGSDAAEMFLRRIRIDGP